ncbi:hypothetical protein Syun_006437 [Stephania yunnanensis]|uniref:SHSP domain-containing protein n=1 Tax=Stephania yunnanensis TaxID=152371 RepID=A0AAP0KWW1_9MAGN
MSMDGIRSAPNYRIISFHPLVEETLKIYLPGFKKKDLYVRLLPQGVLQIGGKRSLDEEGIVKSFQYEIGFPKSGKIGDIKASFKNGVLQITFPKQLIMTEAVAQTQQQEPLRSTLPLKDSTTSGGPRGWALWALLPYPLNVNRNTVVPRAHSPPPAP